MDCSVTPLRQHGLMLVQTTDFFYPLVDDPYMQGKIACANVLSDLYSLGVTECDGMQMILGIPQKFTAGELDTVIPLIMSGFRDAAKLAGTSITGGCTLFNPWCMIGGVASSAVFADQIIPPHAEAGDVLVLTKPLGTQVAVNAHQWKDQNTARYKKLIASKQVTDEDIDRGYHEAVYNMAQLNLTAATLMHRFNARGATDVTGFGLLGHAKNLAKYQQNEVKFVIHNLPVIAKMAVIAKTTEKTFQLLQGYSAETSGGLLITFPREQAASFCQELQKQTGNPAWIIGVVDRGERAAVINSKPRVIEVTTNLGTTVEL